MHRVAPMQRIALASSRTLCNDVKWLTAARQLSSDAATGSITPAQPSNRAEPDGNWVREMLGVQESYVGQNAKNPAWINSTTGAVIGGECETPSMERFRRVNQSLPRLKGQVVKAHIIAVDQHMVEIDPGYKYTQRFFKSELQNVPIYSEDGTRLGVPEEYQVGDIMHVKIDLLQTPFDDMQLSLGGKLTEAEQVELVLQELKKALVERTTVMGRILNPVNKGYAVGIGGLVCFLPVTQCLYETSQRLGVLQPFRVGKITMETRNAVVYDAAKLFPRAYPAGYAQTS